MTTGVVLTGASGGIGQALAFAFAARGCALWLLGRSSPRAHELVEELRSRGHEVQLIPCDLADRASVDSALLQLRGLPVDVVVHNAGIVERAAVQEQSDELWDRHFEVNVTAPMRITRALLPGLLERPRARVLFVASISAVLGTARQSAYNASKAALVGLMRCLAEELSDSPVSTMALLPGSVDTPMLAGSPFPPRMSPSDVTKTLLFHALDSERGHNGAVVEMFGI